MWRLWILQPTWCVTVAWPCNSLFTATMLSFCLIIKDKSPVSCKRSVGAAFRTLRNPPRQYMSGHECTAWKSQRATNSNAHESVPKLRLGRSPNQYDSSCPLIIIDLQTDTPTQLHFIQYMLEHFWSVSHVGEWLMSQYSSTHLPLLCLTGKAKQLQSPYSMKNKNCLWATSLTFRYTARPTRPPHWISISGGTWNSALLSKGMFDQYGSKSNRTPHL